MEKHRPGFLSFILERKKLYCKKCGVELQLSKKQKMIHLRIFPLAYTFTAIMLMSFDLPWYEPIKSLTSIPVVNRMIIALIYVVLFVPVLYIQYRLIRFEPVRSEEESGEP